MKKNSIGRVRDYQELFEALSNSKMYSDYQDAFGKATGVPLILHQGGECKFVLNPKTERIPFCTLMAHTKRACAECYKLSSELEPRLAAEARALYCFAGLCEAEIPVRLGKNVIGFLQTGQVLLSDPSRKEFNRIAKTLLDWGTEVDLKRLEEYYFSLRVLSPEQYHSLLRLLSVFAEHLAACANRFRMERKPARSGPIVKAKRLVQERFQERVSLKEVAAAVNVSATYFSRLFRQATGMTFVDFVARYRIEKAKNLLQDPHWRISEVAFEVGFQSLSQFNRSFRRIEGQSPKQYRGTMTKCLR
jgi:AraC-like DNA-binding protein/ligand-binding sensor protein